MYGHWRDVVTGGQVTQLTDMPSAVPDTRTCPQASGHRHRLLTHGLLSHTPAKGPQSRQSLGAGTKNHRGLFRRHRHDPEQGWPVLTSRLRRLPPPLNWNVTTVSSGPVSVEARGGGFAHEGQGREAVEELPQNPSPDAVGARRAGKGGRGGPAYQGAGSHPDHCATQPPDGQAASPT